jgi:hypothetical protein
MRYIFKLLVAIILFTNQIFAQSVTIDPSNPSVLVDFKSSTNGLSLPRMTILERGALIPTAGLMVFCKNCSPVGPYVYDGSFWRAMVTASNIPITTYTVGQHAQGGIVIWVDDSGQHGIVAAPQDVPLPSLPPPIGGIQGIHWGYNPNDPYGVALAIRSGIYDGEANTEAIVKKFGWAGNAAFFCSQMNFNKYGGWYLPSLNELKVMYENKHFLTEIYTEFKPTCYYWSSTETSPNEAALVNLFDGEVVRYPKYATSHESSTLGFLRARAVRRF